MAVLDRTGIQAQAAEREGEARLSLRLLLLAVAVVGLAGLVPVLQTSYATERGASIRALEQRRTELQAVLHDAEAEFAFLASSQRIRAEATERLGMVPAKQILYVPLDGPAPAQRLPERYVREGPSTPAGGSEPWWRRFTDLLPLP